MRVLVTGGAGFIGSALCRYLVGDEGAHGAQRRQADLCRQPRLARADRDSPRYTFRKADICDRARMVDAVRRVPARCGHASGRRKPCRPLDHRLGGLHRDQHRRHLSLLEAARALLDRPAGGSEGPTSASCTSRPTRSSARSAPTACSAKTTPYDPRSPYSASKAASDHLVLAWHRTYGLPVADLQLLEQLRALSVSREADPADDPQCARRASRCRSTATARTSATGSTSTITPARCDLILNRGRPGETYNVGGAQRAAPTSTSSSASATLLDRLGAGARAAPRADHFRRRPAGSRSALCDRRHQDRTELGWRPRRLRHGARQDRQWYLDNEYWWRPLREARYAGERLGLVRAKVA